MKLHEIIKKPTGGSLALLSAVCLAALTGFGAMTQIDVSLNSASYVKIMDHAGPLAGTWSLAGITAHNGAQQTYFLCTSNRIYTSATAAAAVGALPKGPYVHQLSVFNQWDGTRTRSYRVQLAQPVGENGLYARVVSVTVSQEGVNLLSCPDPRELMDDATQIAASYTSASDLANFSVTKLYLEKSEAYVESPGTLFMNSGWCVTPTTRIEVDFALTDTSNSQTLFGYRDGANSERCLCYIGSGRISFDCTTAGGARSALNVFDVDTERHVAIIDFTLPVDHCQILTDGVFAKGFTLTNNFPETTGKYPVGIFGQNRAQSCVYTNISQTTWSGPAKMKLYGMRIYDDGVLVRNFLPRSRVGVAGLRDEVTGVFVTGEDVSLFTAGGGGVEESDDPYLLLDNALGNGVANASHYIKTGYPVGPDTRIEFDFAQAVSHNSNPYIFSACADYTTLSSTSGTSMMELYTLANSGYGYTYNGTQKFYASAGGVQDLVSTRAADKRRTFVMSASSLGFITAGWTNVTVTTDGSFATTLSDMVIGCRNDCTRFSSLKIYGLKYYENDELVKNYIPTVTNGVPALVEATSGVALYPVTYWSGATTNITPASAGGAIRCTDGSDEAYLEFDGTVGHAINTEYTVTKDTAIEIDMSLLTTQVSPQQFLFEQRGYVSATSGNGVWARLYVNAAGFAYSLCDYVIKGTTHGSFTSTGVKANNNERRQIKLDGFAGTWSIKNGETVLGSGSLAGVRTATDCTRTLYIGGRYDGNGNPAMMRLYNFRISEAGKEVRNYMPCVRNGIAGLYETHANEFLPLAGGKVSGATLKGEAFQIAPEPAKLAKGDAPATLRCLAAGAQSYEWYVDGVKIDGETGETLSVEWIGKRPYTRTYSVRPVYTVFNERVLGDPAEALVEFTPQGLVISIK